MDGLTPEQGLRLQRFNCAIMIEFEVICENKEVTDMMTASTPAKGIIIATTHLFWDPRKADVKLIQAQYLTSKIDEFNKDTNLPVILTGDMNSMPGSEVYCHFCGIEKSFIRESDRVYFKPIDKHGSLKPLDGIVKKSYKSAYHGHGVDGGEPQFTNFTPTFKATLDYVS
jgi:CCR4-NOT transcription complex subunit 6